MNAPDCLHIVRNAVSHDSRVLKETASVAASGLLSAVEICGFHEPGYAQHERLDERSVWRVALKTRSLPKGLAWQGVKYLEWYLQVVNKYKTSPLKVIHCHDLGPLPIAKRLKQLTGAKLIYDAHELESEMAGLRGFRKVLAREGERRLMSSVDTIITVSPSIQTWYQEHFPAIPTELVRNIPEAPETPVTPEPLRNRLQVPDDALLFIYLGGLSKGRGIENVVAAFSDERVSHHVLFLGNGPLRDEVEAAGETCRRIHYLPPVAPSEVLRYTAGADVGLSLIEDACLSYRYCLPNKLFETLVAGLPVLVSDLPDQATVVRQYDAGWIVTNDREALTATLSRLAVSEARELRRELRQRVRDLDWHNEAKTLLNVYGGFGLC